jgi:hypothetical protein
MTHTLKLGKKPARYDANTYRYADVRPSGLIVPKAPSPGGGYGTDFNNWGMLGNGPDDDGTLDPSWAGYKGAGDCFFAGVGHGIMESTKNAGKPVPAISSLTALRHYSAVTGYNIRTGAGDNGTDVLTALKWLQKTGYTDNNGTAHKIGTYVSLEPGNLAQMWEALWLFEEVGMGFNFPESAMDQFNNGQTWSVVPGAQIDGGHYVPLVGHPTDNVWTCVTWAKRQTMTAAFITKYCDEVYAWIDPDRFNAVTGLTLQKFDEAELEQYIATLMQGL